MAIPTPSDTNDPRLPAFLKLSKAEVSAKFIDLEWQQRNRLLHGTQEPVNVSDPPSKWSRLSGEAIAARNRYFNVEPYAQNRVKLRVVEGASDYINASPIQLGRRKYIATQGPKDTSVNHFWKMVAHEVSSPVVVVMLTQTHEAGKEKCFQYYPLSVEESPLVVPPDQESNDTFRAEVILDSIEESNRAESEIRHLRLRSQEDEGAVTQDKEIYHLLFEGWPDFLVPEGNDKLALIELIRLSALLNRPQSSAAELHTDGHSNSFAADLASTDQDNPRIIHCSAGVGRSGTFITLDYLLTLLYTGQLDNVPPEQDPIADTVDLLRQQRMMMVQSESQFQFLYEVFREQYCARLSSPNGNGSDAVEGAPSSL